MFQQESRAAAYLLSHNKLQAFFIFVMMIIYLEPTTGTIGLLAAFCSLLCEVVRESIYDMSYLFNLILSTPLVFGIVFGVHLICAISHTYFFQASCCGFFAGLLSLMTSYTYQSILGQTNFLSDRPTCPSKDRDSEIERLNSHIQTYRDMIETKDTIIKISHTNNAKCQQLIKTLRNDNQSLRYNVQTLTNEIQSYERALATLYRYTPSGIGASTIATKEAISMTRAELYLHISDLRDLLDHERTQHGRTENLLHKSETEHHKTSKTLEKALMKLQAQASRIRNVAVPKSHKEEVRELERVIKELKLDRDWYNEEVKNFKDTCNENKRVLEETERVMKGQNIRLSAFQTSKDRLSTQLEDAYKSIKALQDEITTLKHSHTQEYLEAQLAEKLRRFKAMEQKKDSIIKEQDDKIKLLTSDRFSAIRNLELRERDIQQASTANTRLQRELKETRKCWEAGLPTPDVPKMLTAGEEGSLFLGIAASGKGTQKVQKQIDNVAASVQEVAIPDDVDFTDLYKSASKCINDLHAALTARNTRIHRDPSNGEHPVFLDLKFEQLDDQAYARAELAKIGERMSMYVGKLGRLSWMDRGYKGAPGKAPVPSAQFVGVLQDTLNVARKVGDLSPSWKPVVNNLHSMLKHR